MLRLIAPALAGSLPSVTLAAGADAAVLETQRQSVSVPGSAPHRSSLAAVSLCFAVCVAAPAGAAVIVQTIDPVVQVQGPYTGDQIVAVPFQSSAGALTGVTLEIEGVLTPQGDGVTGSLTAATLTASLSVVPDKLGPDSFLRSFPAEPGTVGHIVGEGPARLETAAAFAIDETFDFTDLTRFIDVALGPVDLVYYGFSTISSAGPIGLDRTHFDGSAILTYTYSTGATALADVPEPASAALLGFGATAFALARRRAVRRSAQ